MQIVQMMFSIYDSKAEAYIPPFPAETIGLALRRFQQAAEEPNSNINKWPTDFCLFHVGWFDQANADYKKIEPKVSLGLASEKPWGEELHPELIGHEGATPLQFAVGDE